MINLYIESRDENTPEYRFFAAILKHWGLDTFCKIIPCNGNSNIPIEDLRRRFDNEECNLVIFDADNYDAYHGFTAIYTALTKKLRYDKYQLAHLFLMPNNESDGCVEDLMLEALINHNVDQCFNAYVCCIRAHTPEWNPTKKARVFAYAEAMQAPNTLKKHGWGFENEAIWNLDAQGLSALKHFLFSHMQ